MAKFEWYKTIFHFFSVYLTSSPNINDRHHSLAMLVRWAVAHTTTIPESKGRHDLEISHVPSIHGIRRKTNESSDKVHAASLKNVDNVTAQQVPVLLSEALEKVRHHW